MNVVDKLADKLSNIDRTTDNNINAENINNISLDENIKSTFLDEENFSDDDYITSNNANNNVETNCLALTVRKDYNLVIVKNIFTASGRISWKVLVATAIINFLNLIF